MMSDNENITTLPLSQAEIGKRYQVVSVNAKGPVLQRMLDMGLVPGSRLWVVRFAPLGDPIEIRIRHFLMSLRKEEAKDVEVVDIGYHLNHHGRGQGRGQGKGQGRGRKASCHGGKKALLRHHRREHED